MIISPQWSILFFVWLEFECLSLAMPGNVIAVSANACAYISDICVRLNFLMRAKLKFMQIAFTWGDSTCYRKHDQKHAMAYHMELLLRFLINMVTRKQRGEGNKKKRTLSTRGCSSILVSCKFRQVEDFCAYSL